MRLFAAVDTPDELKAALDSFSTRLRPAAELSWSRPENLHITTQFIGEWPQERLAELETALAGVPRPGAIDIAIKGVDWFPAGSLASVLQPRVFFAGVQGGEALRSLARATGEALARIGVAIEERAYSPHLTLARMRASVPLEAFHKALHTFPAGCGVEFGNFRATQFHLYSSANGKYTQRAAFPLE